MIVSIPDTSYFASIASSSSSHVIHSHRLMVRVKAITVASSSSQCSIRELRAISGACKIVSLHLHCFGYYVFALLRMYPSFVSVIPRKKAVGQSNDNGTSSH